MLASGQAPGGPLLRSKARVSIEPDAEEAMLLARRGVNVLRAAAPGFISFTGDVTLARSHGARREWQQLTVRRRAMLIAGTISRSTRWAAVQKPGADTWRAVTVQVGRYLASCAEAGLLVGDTTQRGFYVKCDQDTNAGRSGLCLVVGLALARAGDFVAFRFEHDAPECRVTELAWQPGLGLAG
jgi:phage tail sheath protein FI